MLSSLGKAGFLLLNVLLKLLHGKLLPELGLKPGDHFLDVDHLHEVCSVLGLGVLANLIDSIELKYRAHE